MTISDHGITVTIKYGAKYDDTWAVFKGVSVADVRQLVCDFFGVDPASVSELSTHELVVDLTAVAHGTTTASSVLNAVAIPAGQTPAPTETGNPWAGLDEENKQHPYQAVLDAMTAASSVQELQKVWAANQPAFTDETVVAAYKARGKELSQ